MFDIHRSVADPVTDEIDHDLMREFIDDLLEIFHRSAEFTALPDEARCGNYAAIFLEYAFDYCCASLSELDVSDAREVIFEIFPRKLSAEPVEAESIVAQLRAFFSFLDREHHLLPARRIAKLLDTDAERRLRHELGNPANYGMAKSLFMTGREAGYDMTSEAGCQAFMAAYNARILSERVPAQPFFPLAEPARGDLLMLGDFDDPMSGRPFRSRAEQDERKKARKEKRKARKRNRR